MNDYKGMIFLNLNVYNSFYYIYKRTKYIVKQCIQKIQFLNTVKALNNGHLLSTECVRYRRQIQDKP